MVDFQRKERYTVQDLEEIVRILRDPDFGCPWDKVQTHASIRKDFLEETCEVLEAIDREDPTLLKEELGDVMMQVMLPETMPTSIMGKFRLRICSCSYMGMARHTVAGVMSQEM